MVAQAINRTTSEGTMQTIIQIMQCITNAVMNINPVAAENAGEPQMVGVREKAGATAGFVGM